MTAEDLLYKSPWFWRESHREALRHLMNENRTLKDCVDGLRTELERLFQELQTTKDEKELLSKTLAFREDTLTALREQQQAILPLRDMLIAHLGEMWDAVNKLTLDK